MRVPKRVKGQSLRDTVSGSQSYPAPVGGWNAKDALADMKPTDAIALENWFPKTSYVEMRGGSSDHATGMTGTGKTLAVYNKFSGASEMYAITESGVYDVTSAGAVGASKAARTNGKHQWISFGDGTNQWLIMLNGVDKPIYYDGTTWTAVDALSTPALTGVTTTNLIGVNIHKGRLFFIEKNTLSFWYLSSGVAGGALTEFDLAGVAQEGGFLMAMGTWTIDSGNGPDDRAVFVTSEGEVLVYAGTNPSSAADWGLIGVYKIGKPLGRRCLSKIAGDLLIITQNGVFPMSAAIQSETIDYKLAISFKIENAFNEASQSYGDNFGWKAQLYPTESALLINVPISEDGTHEQYVMNTITKSWCKFKAWDAEDFAQFNNELYYVDGTKVIKAWTGSSDNGANITYYAKCAFTYFGDMIHVKKFKMFKPVLGVNGTVNFLTDIDVDFSDNLITGTATYNVVNNALWDSAIWDASSWAAGLEIVQQWTSPASYQGRCAAGKLKIDSNNLSVQWLANDYIYEKGNLL
jgi:hypothetical protein